jgi:hypothetical protein
VSGNLLREVVGKFLRFHEAVFTVNPDASGRFCPKTPPLKRVRAGAKDDRATVLACSGPHINLEFHLSSLF